MPFDAERVRVLFNQLEFRTLLPRILDALGDVGARQPRRAETFEVEVVDRARRRRRGRGVAGRATRRRASRSRRAGRARPAAAISSRLAVSTGDDAHLHRRATCSPTPTVRDGARGARRAATSRSLVAHRAKELAHGLARRPALARARHRARWRTCSIPGEGKYPLEDLALPLPLDRARRRPTRSRARSISTATPASTTRSAAPRCSLRLADALDEALRRARARRPLRAHRAPARAACSRAMEDAGVRIDLEFLEELGKELNDECRRLEAEIHTHAGEQFNVNSTPQLRRILFEKLGLTPVKKTKTGPSTDADSLQKLAEEHPIVETLLRYREVEKLRSTYADALPPLVGPTAASTPRSTSSRPRPAASRRSRRTCRTFRCAPSGGRELRRGVHRRRRLRAAHRRLLADRAARARAPRRRPGPHRRVRARRRRAHHHRGRACSTSTKTRSTSSSAASPRSSTTASRTAWRRTASRSASTSRPIRRARSSTRTSPRSRTSPAYMKETIREAKACGYTTTLFGRRRQLPELSSDNFRIRQMGERMAQNAPVQGTAADIFKLAMIDLDRALDGGRAREPHGAHRARRARARGAARRARARSSRSCAR